MENEFSRPTVKGIRAIRRLRDLTQEELASASGVSRVTIANIETDKRSPTVDTLKKLSKALDCLIDDLVN